MFLSVNLIHWSIMKYTYHLAFEKKKKYHFCDSKFTWEEMHDNARELAVWDREKDINISKWEIESGSLCSKLSLNHTETLRCWNGKPIKLKIFKSRNYYLQCHQKTLSCVQLYIERKLTSPLKIWITVDRKLGSLKFLFEMRIMKERTWYLGKR